MLMKIDRKAVPEFKPIGNIKIREAEKTWLDNGIPVYSINAGFQDIIKIELIFFNDGFDPIQPLAVSAANRMLGEGTSKHNAQQLAELIDHSGAYYETEESADYCSVVLFTLNKYLDNTLPVIREILTDAAFPESELSTFRQNNRQRLTVENEKVSSVSRKKFNEVLFGSVHPYGYYTRSDDYTKLSRESLLACYQKNYHSGNCHILVAGKVNGEAITTLNRVFGKEDWKKNTSSPKQEISIQSDKIKKHQVEKKEAIQSSIRIGKVLFNKTHPDYIGMTILNTALGGYFGSRLMNNIREDKGYTYSIGSAVVSLKQAGYFFISTEAGTDVTMKTIDEIYKEVERLGNEPVGNDELQMVKNFMIGNFLKGIDGAFHLSDRWKGLLLYGLEYDYYYRYLDTIQHIQPEQLQSLANKYLNTSDFYEVVAGKKE